MNMMQAFHRTMDYIESVLDEEIDEARIAQLSGYSYPMFSRLFSILTEMPLSEYIRSRRLTKAALDLRETDEKIVDMAMRYGYESSNAFANAFRRFHGYAPSEVRKGKPFRVVSRLRLVLRVKGGTDMNITIQRKPAFTVAGVEASGVDSTMCPKVWDALFAKCPRERMTLLGSGQSYGMCHDVEDVKRINYMAAYDVEDVEAAMALGLEVRKIPEAEYAVAELCGPVPRCIHAGWKYLMETFFPEQGYRHSGQPDFEVYGEGDMYSEGYRMHLWVPVVREREQ